MRHVIYGPPGTGKTHTLLGHIEKFLANTPSDKIGYFTFSKNAAQEGKQRAVDKFKLSYNDVPYFQTLHSFCFNQPGDAIKALQRTIRKDADRTRRCKTR